MTVALARRLVWDGLVGADEANRALHAHVTRRIGFLQALLEVHPELAARLEAELGASRAGVQTAIIPDRELVRGLPKGLCAALLAVPVGRDPRTGAVRILAADASDPHVADELGHHFGGRVEVGKAPLRAILAALWEPTSEEMGPTGTPAFGTRTSTVSDRPEVSPSQPPIPLVRVTEQPQAPKTVKGVAPQASTRGHASPVVVSGGTSNRPVVEPVIELTRAKSLAPPATVKGTGPGSAVGQEPDARTSRAPDDRAPFGDSQPPELVEESVREELERAKSPEDVIRVIVGGLARVARRVVVLAVRGKVFEGRDANDETARSSVRNLVVSADRPSVLLTAVQTGSYVGPMPETRVHAELGKLLGGSTNEIAVGTVLVSGRAAIVYVMTGFDTAYLATRRAADLAQAAGNALERIVRGRRK